MSVNISAAVSPDFRGLNEFFTKQSQETQGIFSARQAAHNTISTGFPSTEILEAVKQNGAARKGMAGLYNQNDAPELAQPQMFSVSQKEKGSLTPARVWEVL